MISQKRLLIPSVNFDDLAGIKKLSGYFPKFELDLFGLKRELPPAEMARLHATKKLMDECGVGAYSVHLRSLDLSKPGTSAKLEAAVRYCSEINRIFNPEIAVLHPGRGDMRTLLAGLGFVLERIPQSMTIAMENMTGAEHVLHSPETIRAFIEGSARLPPNLALCIDTTHPGFAPGSADPEAYTSLVLEYIRAALPKLGHLHFSDRRDGDESSKHLPIGAGLVGWERVDGFLRQAGYGKRAAIEIRFTDDIADKIIASACAYYGCKQTDLKLGMEEGSMADTASKSDFVAKLEALPSYTPIPDSVSSLLNLPEKAVLEKSDDYVYFIVPSDSYKKGHADPFDVLYGDALDRFDWAEFVFGVRYHGSHLSAVLVDKERRIAICDTLLSMHSKEKMSWSSFETALKKALEYAKTESPNPRMKTDHVMVTPYGGVQFIYVMDELAWGRDY